MAKDRLRLKQYGYAKWEFCKYCNSIIKTKELNWHENSCLFKKAAAKASIVVRNGQCNFCNEIVRHTDKTPCKKRMKWLVTKALSGNCNEAMKSWIHSELVKKDAQAESLMLTWLV